MLQKLFSAPWVDETDAPQVVRQQAIQAVYQYWRTRGWQLVLGEAILFVAAVYQDIPQQTGYLILALGVLGVYLVGFVPRLMLPWFVVLVTVLMLQGMLVAGLGAVTALSYMLPYTFSALMQKGRGRVFVQALCVMAFWVSLLYEVLPIFPQLNPPRSILVSYNILLAAFTFQGLRFLNQLSVELNTRYVEATVRQQSHQFLARVSHELRTPLNSVLGFARLLNRKAEPFTETQQNYLRYIIDEGEQLNHLVSDLLDSAHLSTGKLTLSKSVCDANAICQTVADEHRPHLPAGVRLDLQFAPDLPPLMADPTRLRQAVGNLVANAIKHTAQGSIKIHTQYQEQQLWISVMDTGVGIPPEQQALIFVPFVQLDRQKAGVGLGLDIALQLVQLHGGTLDIESQVGQGSRFTIRLPVPVETY